MKSLFQTLPLCSIKRKMQRFLVVKPPLLVRDTRITACFISKAFNPGDPFCDSVCTFFLTARGGFRNSLAGRPQTAARPAVRRCQCGQSARTTHPASWPACQRNGRPTPSAFQPWADWPHWRAARAERVGRLRLVTIIIIIIIIIVENYESLRLGSR